MTLIVSLRTPDGIVIAGDSLASMMTQMNFEANLEVECPDCGKIHPMSVSIPMPPQPATTLSYAQKVFPFLKKYGVGTSGSGMLLGKSIYYLSREFEQTMSASHNLVRINGVIDVANEFGTYFHDLAEKHFKTGGKSLDEIPPEGVILGFQIVGYDKGEAKIMEVKIGKEIQIIDHTTGSGSCTLSGQFYVAQALWSLHQDPSQQPAWDVFSLQDAIAYVEYLINTTATHQKFSRRMPNVGGAIDIALVTPFNNFQWIVQKPLSKLLGD
jgi:hypothetical protein